VIAFTVAVAAGFGTFLLYTSAVLGWRGFGLGPRSSDSSLRRRVTVQDWLRQAGMEDVRPVEFVAVELVVLFVGVVFGYLTFATAVPALAVGCAAAGAPIAMYRGRRRRLREEANDAWPRLIEEIRLQTVSMGRSVPLAVLDVGRDAPTAPMRTAFDAAQREWLLTTDFALTVRVLKDRLADPTADAACETLLVAHEVGGADLDRRLGALAEDRMMDQQSRKDGRSKQAGVRFARWFTIIAPLGMALVGLSIGNGRDAYRSPFGQAAVLVGITMTALCWWWANSIMRLPEGERVFKE
jgi:tight adherence protein B